MKNCWSTYPSVQAEIFAWEPLIRSVVDQPLAGNVIMLSIQTVQRLCIDRRNDIYCTRRGWLTAAVATVVVPSPPANCCISSFRAGKPRRSRTRIPSAGRKKPLVRVDFLVANTTPLVFFRPFGAGAALQLITGKSIAITHYTRTQHTSPPLSPITMLHIGRAPILYTMVTRVRPSSSSWRQKRFIIIRFDVDSHTEITDRLLVSASGK